MVLAVLGLGSNLYQLHTYPLFGHPLGCPVEATRRRSPRSRRSIGDTKHTFDYFADVIMAALSVASPLPTATQGFEPSVF